MRENEKHYNTTRALCLKIEFANHRAYGLLQPLEAPREKQIPITMDFITSLPSSTNKNSGFSSCRLVIQND